VLLVRGTGSAFSASLATAAARSTGATRATFTRLEVLEDVFLHMSELLVGFLLGQATVFYCLLEMFRLGRHQRVGDVLQRNALGLG
jgi:hypothetical protein